MTSQLSAIQRQLQIFQQLIEGELGVCARHLTTGRMVRLNAEQSFLMCSTYKIPIAICFMQKVELGQFNLEQLYEVTEFDIRPGNSFTLNQLDFSKSNLHISLYNLLRLMLQESCNSATDILLRLIGGPQAVMHSLAEAKIKNLSINRYTLELLAHSDGIYELPADMKCSIEQYKSLLQNSCKKMAANLGEDNRDSTTPQAMVELLSQLTQHQLLSSHNSELLLAIMRGCKRGPNRLLGLLPPKTPLAHKTGTAHGFTCDVGIMTLPFHLGNVAIAAYIKNSTDLNCNEQVLAQVGRSIYDYFLFTIDEPQPI